MYRCFGAVWNNCFIHDIWEEHFEGGFTLGDVFGKVDNSDGIKIVNCRIRNNYV